MDKDWTEAQGADLPGAAASFATNLQTNITDPFHLIRRTLDGETVLEPFAQWWDIADPNPERAVYHPMPADGTRVAAPLPGALEMMEPVPLQEVPRLVASQDIGVLSGIESRFILLNFYHASYTRTSAMRAAATRSPTSACGASSTRRHPYRPSSRKSCAASRSCPGC